ncbi:MAG: Phenylalanine--tRNA ligase alpha subunit [Bacteroidota bacterium]|jgi:phenylalanyl-tRNA synthetase alpha chain
MFEKINQFIAEAEAANPEGKEQLEAYRLQYLGKKGVLTDLFAMMKEVPAEQRKEFGQLVNKLKNVAEEKVNAIREQLENQVDTNAAALDLTLPGVPQETGAMHPISIVRNEINRIFSRIGFTVSDGPEVEDDWHNFSALNFPPEHPARDMQDTFFINLNPNEEHYYGSLALRTHTSSVQIRVLDNQEPPVRTICPGRVYRNEAISARAHCFFHQVEGFYIDKGVSFADLKQTLLYFAQEMFGSETKIRLRPSYFPFTEPSAEMDISCSLCKGDGCNVCKHTGWVEILGCGMIDPAVLENCNIDSNVYTGFAFGMGIERITMLKYGVKDLRLFSENDLRFLKQFRGVI